MYKNRSRYGKNSICCHNIRLLRVHHQPRLSQRALSEQLQLLGLDLDKNAIQRIESGQRFVTDIELKTLARFFAVTTDELLQEDELT